MPILVDEGILEGSEELIAGVLCAHKPFPHGQSLAGSGRYNITHAGIHKHLCSNHGPLNLQEAARQIQLETLSLEASNGQTAEAMLNVHQNQHLVTSSDMGKLLHLG